MKFFYLMATLAILFSSCQKELSTEPPGTNGNSASKGTFTAVIDGKNWQAVADKQSASIITGTIGIMGASSDGQVILIDIIGTKAGTYNLYEQDPGVLVYKQSQTSLDSYASNASSDSSKAGGQVTISSIDTVSKTIVGTFTAIVTSPTSGLSTKITGQFNLSYTTTISDLNGNPVSTTDTVKAVIDGKAWTAPVVIGTSISGIMVSGSAQDNTQTIGFKVPADVSEGTYNFDGMFSPCVGLFNIGPDVMTQKNFVATSGTIKITEHNKSKKHIRGTFEFTGSTMITTETVQITQGYFSLTYQ